MPTNTTKEVPINMHHEYFELVQKYYKLYGKKNNLINASGCIL